MKALKYLLAICMIATICTSIAQGLDTRLKVNIDSGNLNVRKEPSIDAEVVVKVPKESYLLFQMENRGLWLKVKYVQWGDMDVSVKEYIGWVHSDFVECPYLKTTLLDVKTNETDWGTYFSTIQGNVMVVAEDESQGDVAYVYSNGVRTELKKKEGSLNTYSGSGITVEVMIFQTDEGYEYWSFTGFLRIEKAGKVEYVFVTAEFSV
ncbi:MAG: SH3 domain-containing protein [Flavobacteriales bacterium]